MLCRSFGLVDVMKTERGCLLVRRTPKTGRLTISIGEHCIFRYRLQFSHPAVHRFVDRDMLMRFHWGLAVGHVYTHRLKRDNPSVSWPNNLRRTSASEATHNESHARPGDEDTAEAVRSQAQDIVDEGSDSEDGDVVPEEPDLANSSDEEGGGTAQDQGDSEDEEEVRLEDMYGYIDSEGDVDSGMD